MGASERIGLAVGLVLAGVLMWPLRDVLVDSAFVWLRFADHLAHGRGLVFNLGERLYATTNPLWITLIADGVALGLDGLTVAKVLGAAATFAAVVLYMQLLRRTVRTPFIRGAATVAWAANAWMMQWSVSGLETALATALVLAGFVALTEGPEWGDRPIRTGSLWALAALTRPGAVLLLVLWVTALLVDARSRPGLRRLVYGTLPALAIYGSWLLFARFYFGSFWPRVLSLAGAHGQSGGWWEHVVREVSGLAITDAPLLVVGALALVFSRSSEAPGSRSALRMLPWAWVLLLPALFASRGLGVTPRQLMIMVPILHALAWQAIDRWWVGRDPRPRSRLATGLAFGLAGLLVVQNIAVYRSTVLPTMRDGTTAMRSGLLRWGHWLRRHASPRAVVASETTGLIAVTSGLRVIDLDGLLSAGMLEIGTQVPPDDIVPRLAFEPVARAEYVIDRGRTPEELRRKSPYPEAFRTLDQSGEYVFYRIDWDVVDRLRKRRRS